MQLKTSFVLAMASCLLPLATPIILLTSSATAATTALTLGVTVSNPALAAVGGAAVLLGAAGLVAAKAAAFASSRRGRRSATLADDGYSLNAVDVLFAAAGSLDRNSNCGLRLVCELSATPSEGLAEDEALLVALFGGSNDHISGGPATPFQMAAFLGRASSGLPSACAKAYTKCQYNAAQIMGILRENAAGQL